MALWALFQMRTRRYLGPLLDFLRRLAGDYCALHCPPRVRVYLRAVLWGIFCTAISVGARTTEYGRGLFATVVGALPPTLVTLSPFLCSVT